MAADRDEAQQTEEPTQRRLDDARAHGDIAKSAEVTTFAVLAGGAVGIAAFGRQIAENFAGDFRVFLEQPDQLATDKAGVMTLMEGAGDYLGLLLAPFFA